ncbi:hypothetical protein [Hydrogenophaga sp.]|uniref:hypothetical protein n=1 Tax=Hydrogenophaga sp. TaxID=1904254 RepID=UPI002612464E|nr:hypothetical protein [Hydrogenophaga sp.]MCW5654046.1 hypothetical protein [Hydrogenophaga sp.]
MKKMKIFINIGVAILLFLALIGGLFFSVDDYISWVPLGIILGGCFSIALGWHWFVIFQRSTKYCEVKEGAALAHPMRGELLWLQACHPPIFFGNLNRPAHEIRQLIYSHFLSGFIGGVCAFSVGMLVLIGGGYALSEGLFRSLFSTRLGEGAFVSFLLYVFISSGGAISFGLLGKLSKRSSRYGA